MSGLTITLLPLRVEIDGAPYEGVIRCGGENVRAFAFDRFEHVDDFGGFYEFCLLGKTVVRFSDTIQIMDMRP